MWSEIQPNGSQWNKPQGCWEKLRTQQYLRNNHSKLKQMQGPTSDPLAVHIVVCRWVWVSVWVSECVGEWVSVWVSEWVCGWVSGAWGVYVSEYLWVSDVIKGKDGRGMPDTERNKNPQIILICSVILKLIKRNIPNFHFF